MSFRNPNSTAAQIDWGDPISYGLRLLYLLDEPGGNHFTDLATPKAFAIRSGIGTQTSGVGQFGLCLSSTGGDGLHVDHPRLNFTEQITVCGWVKLSASTTNYPNLFDKNRSAQWSLVAAYAGLQPRFIIVAGGTRRDIFAEVNLPVGVWVHVAGTYNGAAGSLYLNGALAPGTSARLPFTGAIGTGGAALRMGCDMLSATSAFEASFNNLRIYSRALIDGELSRLYRQPFAGIMIPRRRIITAAAGFHSRYYYDSFIGHQTHV